LTQKLATLVRELTRETKPLKGGNENEQRLNTEPPRWNTARLYPSLSGTRENAFRAMNRELISMYWEIGAYVSDKVKNGGWGKSVVSDFAKFIQAERPDIKGFSASSIWRMRQFYETYRENEKLAPLVREINWTQNLIIMSRTAISRQKHRIGCSPRQLRFGNS
jgi:hypothetical protein